MADTNRQAARRHLPIRIFRLGEEPRDDDLSAFTTAEERLAILHELSERMWELSGRERPRYARSEIPVRIVRRA